MPATFRPTVPLMDEDTRVLDEQTTVVDRQRLADPLQRSGAPHSVSSRSCFLTTLPPGFRGSGSVRTTTYCGTLKSAIRSRT
jgi:hypothetical protein